MAPIRTCIVIVALIFAAPVLAHDNSWVQVAAPKDGIWVFSIKTDSFKHAKVGSGDTDTIVVGKAVNKKTNMVEISIWRISDKDCAAGYGTLVVANIKGYQRFTASFAEGGQTVASAIASVICSAYHK